MFQSLLLLIIFLLTYFFSRFFEKRIISNSSCEQNILKNLNKNNFITIFKFLWIISLIIFMFCGYNKIFILLFVIFSCFELLIQLNLLKKQYDNNLTLKKYLTLEWAIMVLLVIIYSVILD